MLLLQVLVAWFISICSSFEIGSIFPGVEELYLTSGGTFGQSFKSYIPCRNVLKFISKKIFYHMSVQQTSYIYPSDANNDIVVLPTIRIFVGDIISWIDKIKIACRGKSRYLNGNVNHSFQLNNNYHYIVLLKLDSLLPFINKWFKWCLNR